MNGVIQWANEMNCGITVCDRNCNIIYMNEKAKKIFAKYGELIGKNLMDCHKTERAIETIKRLLVEGGSNSYTINKQGVRKMIYQTAWHQNGEIAGLVEISMEIPQEIPHYIRG